MYFCCNSSQVKKWGGDKDPFLFIIAGIQTWREGSYHPLSESWATNLCQSCSPCLYMRVAAVATLWAPTDLVKMPSGVAPSAPSPCCWMLLRATIQPLDCKWLRAGIMFFFYVKQEQPTLSVLIKKSCCSTLFPWAMVRALQFNMQKTGWILRPARLRKGWVDGKTKCWKNKPHAHGGATSLQQEMFITMRLLKLISKNS